MIERPAPVLDRDPSGLRRRHAVLVHVAAGELRVERRRRDAVGELELQLAFGRGVGFGLVDPDARGIVRHAQRVVDRAGMHRHCAELKRAERAGAVRRDLGRERRPDLQLVQHGLIVLQHHVRGRHATGEQRADLAALDAGLAQGIDGSGRAQLQRRLRFVAPVNHRAPDADDRRAAPYTSRHDEPGTSSTLEV